MTFSSETLGVPPTGLPVLLDLVHERTGLFFGNGRQNLSRFRAPGASKHSLKDRCCRSDAVR